MLQLLKYLKIVTSGFCECDYSTEKRKPIKQYSYQTKVQITVVILQYNHKNTSFSRGLKIYYIF